MSDFVRTPTGIIMHVENHRALVEEARRSRLRGALLMLEPATPIDAAEIFGELDDKPILELATADTGHFTLGRRQELMPVWDGDRMTLVPATPEWIAERDAREAANPSPTFVVTAIDRDAGTITLGGVEKP